MNMQTDMPARLLRHFQWAAGFAAAFFLAASPAFAAQKANDSAPGKPFINTIFPAGGQRGQTLEVVVSGTHLVSGTGSEVGDTIRITGSGLTSKIVNASDPKSIRLSVSIAADAELGEHDLRFVTPDGISNRARFIVGQIPELNEVEPNSDVAHAQRLPSLPVLINGRIDQSDRDFFRFAAKAGQTYVCEVQARAIVPYIADAVPGWFDAILTLYDGAGKPLQTVNGFRFRPDPVLIFTSPQDGEYVLGIWDVLFRGRSDFVYRLSVGQLPYLTHVFPLGGQRGSVVSVEMKGVNLPQSVQQFTFSDDPSPRRPLTVSTPNGWISNSISLAAGDLPETTEVEPNDTQAQAQRVTLPVTINGRIQKSGDVDWFVFTAKAGDKLAMEVLARRLGSPLDSVITLFNAKGAELAENDDTVDLSQPQLTHHADSYLAYTIPAAGDYYLRLKDAQQKGGDEYAYRLTLAPPQPDFSLRITPDFPSPGQGDSAMITVEALRKDGFKGEIPLSIQGLPDGCIIGGTSVIPANQDEMSFTLTLPADAALANFAPVITGSVTLNGKPVVRQAAAAEAVMQAFATTHNMFTQELLLCVTEPPPFAISTSVEPGQTLDLPQGGEIQVTVKAVRKNDVKGAIAITTQRPSLNTTKGRAATPINTRTPSIPADKDETAITITATKQAPLGMLQNIVVIGTLKIGKSSSTALTPAFTVRVVPAPK